MHPPYYLLSYFQGGQAARIAGQTEQLKNSSFQETKQSGTQDLTMAAPANFAGCFLCPHQDPILSSRQDLVNHLETWHKMQRCPFPS